MIERRIENVFQLKAWIDETQTRIHTLKVSFQLAAPAFHEQIGHLYKICDQLADAMDRLEKQGHRLGGLENQYVELIIQLAQVEEQHACTLKLRKPATQQSKSS